MSQGTKTLAWETPPELWQGLRPSSGAARGSIAALYIARQPSGPMESLSEVRAFADRGLEGDRFFRASWSAASRPDKAVSFVEEETLQAAAKELDCEMFGDKSRRNIVTSGVALIDLLDREFTVSGVLMRGIRLFEPCGHLEKVSKIRGIFRALEHRSGLKASILSDGVIRVGDPIVLAHLRQVAVPEPG